MNDHQNALKAKLDEALAAVGSAADSTRAVIEGDIQAMHEAGAAAGRPPLIADVPVDELPPYVPPPAAPAAHALIPDTPLVEAPGATPAFIDDDAPLWQS
jgi:hypothetical protein